MKGIILAGGTGTRLLPLTALTSKQLLPVYDRPMIFYPLNTLIRASVKDILIIVSPGHSGNFLNLLGSMFRKFGVNLSFIVQKSPRGLAEAYILAEDFLDGESSTLVLGDNIFEDDFTEAIRTFEKGGRIFAKEVSDPERFGVVEFDENHEVISIEEKPIAPRSQFAIPGIYIFDKDVVERAKTLTPSERGELEITDLQRYYLSKHMLDVRLIEGAWFDTGTFESLFEASVFAREKKLGDRSHPMINEAIREFNAEYKGIVSLKK
ncbi:MAG: spore coat protein [Candidatus Moranbacteria bacterium CG_4_9_14_3_um_filter_45_14]|nr:MAG: spore coat protein [Candidatus Moranbacteria bacterium CG2_30_45_14]PJA85026.1 MAG: spore coat protein [Candidatus Moranbacteria bacterium CG_4_9_14_3_um_filter_45_14]